MANEITINTSMKVVNSNFTHGPYKLTNLQFDQAAAGIDSFVQNIGTSEEDVTFSVTTHGWFMMRNLDATNYVQWGPKDTTMKAMGRMEAGEPAGPFRVEPGITLRMVANTAACDVLFIMYED